MRVSSSVPSTLPNTLYAYNVASGATPVRLKGVRNRSALVVEGISRVNLHAAIAGDNTGDVCSVTLLVQGVGVWVLDLALIWPC